MVVKVGIINYSVGNLGSLINAFRRVGGEVQLIGPENPHLVRSVDALVLPGVGAFDAAVKYLSQIVDYINEAVSSIPILGICLGLQLMFEGSDEGVLRGLSWYKSWVKRINGPRVPHIGWDLVRVVRPCPILTNDDYYYFMHSYAVINPGGEVPYSGITKYGNDQILSVLCDEDRLVFGVQFHPEKSSRAGLEVLRRFLSLSRK
ncbi:imidazole glycerol phosphate synthase subunit HisH [Vulcanisaeta thermophila]|uniref:imidazole glycerol phosphate synthase subunit HisH n=1 Tax=Vulcanisaeta thermophila TaxID=867917 RepID=UPI000852F5E4|nr:imidazole glycerol phosphate synthase subunit HisH [Vulcanisaeta thermophila]